MTVLAEDIGNTVLRYCRCSFIMRKGLRYYLIGVQKTEAGFVRKLNWDDPEQAYWVGLSRRKTIDRAAELHDLIIANGGSELVAAVLPSLHGLDKGAPWYAVADRLEENGREETSQWIREEMEHKLAHPELYPETNA